MELKSSYDEVPTNETKEKETEHELEDYGKTSWKYFFRQLMVCSCLWSGYFMAGLIQGSPTVIVPQLRKEANSSDAVSDEMTSWMSSISIYAAAPCSLVMPIATNYIGRKYVMMFACCTTLVSFILMYLSKTQTEILIAFLMEGPYLSCNFSISLVIIAEYIAPRYRDVFLTLKSAMFGWGVWTSNVIGTFCPWKNIAILGMAVAAANFFMIVFWPESPYWLASKNKFETCSKSYRWLRGTNKTSEKELEELIMSQKIEDRRLFENNIRNRYKIMNLYKTISGKVFYVPLLLCWAVLCVYIFSGKLVCTIYAIDVIKRITESESTAYTGMLILDGISVLGMYLGSITTKFFMRRTLFIFYTFLCIVFLLTISFYLFLIDRAIFLENAYLSIFLLMLYSLSGSSGPFIMSTSIIGELIPLRNTTLFIICYGSVCCLASATMLKLSLWVFRTFTLAGAFLFYGSVSSLFLCITYMFLPETKDKTLVQIQMNFK